jgi:hypothetical protein
MLQSKWPFRGYNQRHFLRSDRLEFPSCSSILRWSAAAVVLHSTPPTAFSPVQTRCPPANLPPRALFFTIHPHLPAQTLLNNRHRSSFLQSLSFSTSNHQRSFKLVASSRQAPFETFEIRRPEGGPQTNASCNLTRCNKPESLRTPCSWLACPSG